MTALKFIVFLGMFTGLDLSSEDVEPLVVLDIKMLKICLPNKKEECFTNRRKLT